MKKVMVGMSGGVDSSVAAFLLKQQGYEVVGATFKLFDEDELFLNASSKCCSIDDVADAKFVCDMLDIPHYVINYKQEFKNKVIDYFAESYLEGKTPNPCIDCNRHIKFSAFFKKAVSMGFDYIATGHYSSIIKDENTNRYLLKKSETEKDQSYALYYQTQESLKHTLMPLSDYKKEEVREIAKENNLIVYKKPDSQDICFIPDGDYAGFIKKYKNIGNKKGDFLDTNGNIIGKHNGFYNFTIGQRRGLGVGFGARKYVTNLDAKKNTVTIGDSIDLEKKHLYANDLNWISIKDIEDSIKCEAKFRYSQKQIGVTVYKEDSSSVKVVFDTPQIAPAKGQAVVFYNGSIVIGGGTII